MTPLKHGDAGHGDQSGHKFDLHFEDQAYNVQATLSKRSKSSKGSKGSKSSKGSESSKGSKSSKSRTRHRTCT